jgi:quinolinate synthase
MEKKEVIDEINKLREQHNAVILAHNYQIPDIQDVADLVGDSLDLAKKATKTEADVIVFCGVDFMAEAAKILNPDKKVIIPDDDACCPMAAMVTPESLREKKQEYPDAEVVAYINTTADVKAEADICCTSSNGVQVVKSLDAKQIIFVPDKNLGSYIKKQVENKETILWDGFCATHDNITKNHIEKLKSRYPHAEVLVHPECKPAIVELADYAYSTNGMVNHAKDSDKKEFIIGTEKGLCYRLKKENPDKEFYPIDIAVCQNMKKINLEKVLKALQNLEPEVILPDKIMKEAKQPLERMMKVGRGD